MTVTVTLTGRPSHRATFAIDPDCTDSCGPCDGVCVCGGRWCHNDMAAIVMDWYWQHPAPPPTQRAA